MPRPALHIPGTELDACGIGFVADANGAASRQILDLVLEGLARVGHRGAVAADGKTGDGTGVLMPIPAALVPTPWSGLAMVFLRDESARAAIEEACLREGLGIAGWRTVPVEPTLLGEAARATMPRIEQLVVLRPFGTSAQEAESLAFRARKRAQRVPGAYVASLSFRTVTYKALCAAEALPAFYPDLVDPEIHVPFGIFHQRFSTNTTPSWERAQPFRMLCHNGEINAIEGNVNWLRAREGSLGIADEELLLPLVEETSSDSAKLDNALELLVRGGTDVRHAAAMLLPHAWEGDRELDDEVRAFYRHHSTILEPWDGPAAIVFTDGHVVGAALDRNGLRPLRYAITEDGLVTCASEAGAIPLPDGIAARRGRLGPGQMLAVDPAGFGLEEDAALKLRLARRRPYARWVDRELAPASVGTPLEAPAANLLSRQALFGYTREELAVVLRPIAQDGHEPTSSMGDDTALPPLAGRARPLFSYFRQRFAQVTNPPIDHLRERRVTSLRTLLGPRPTFLSDGPAERLVELESFFVFSLSVLSPLLRLLPLDTTFSEGEELAGACERLAERAVEAVREGAEVVVLTDEAAGGDRAAIPSLLALGAVHQRLVETGLRTRTSLVVASGEPRETHHFACLLGYGADAIQPWLALQSLAALAAADRVGGDHPSPEEAQRRFRAAIEDGVLKVMSKMGISDVASYRGAQLFEALGLGDEVVERCFARTPNPIGGIGWAELEREALGRLAAARGSKPELENPGHVKWRKGGEDHATTPEVVDALHEAVSAEDKAAAHVLRKAVRQTEGWSLYQRFAEHVNNRRPLEIRDLLELSPAGGPLPLDEVEPVEEIVKRFSSGAMSHGSLSAEAHETIAIAFNRLRARSNCGEGGESRERFRDERNSRIKQVASGRFGVTPEYASFADELQIKIAQGSKPGEGGQLPGHKVSPEIARLRHTQPGVALISPPPHHDIYSIEDLAQLIFDLRQVNPEAAVSVKLVAETGVGLVAAGVVKALADVVHVAGADGGTGASPLSSIKSAGVPWELGLAETQQTLMAENLRGRVRLRADGGMKTGRDVIVAALLGADEISFGTALLLAEGCLMVRACHLDTCPVGIATQRPELRRKFAATPEMVEAYLLYVAEEVRHHLASLGLKRFDEAVGRVDLLRPRVTDDPRANTLDLTPLLARFGDGPSGYVGEARLEAPGGELGERLMVDAAAALDEVRIVEIDYEIRNGDRTVGARLGGVIGKRFGRKAPPGRVRARFTGAAGQGFGAFLAAGVELSLAGEANDGVGKSMSGGRLVLRAPEGDAGNPVLVGNAALYGATGGELYCAGRAGERFAVRNSGATAVVEGVGDHACEYMTNGRVVIIGDYGRNLGAGMSGGVVYVYDPVERLPLRLNDQLVAAAPLDEAAEAEVRALLERHVRFTDSDLGLELLATWETARLHFRRIAAKAEVATIESQSEGTREAAEEKEARRTAGVAG